MTCQSCKESSVHSSIGKHTQCGSPHSHLFEALIPRVAVVPLVMFQLFFISPCNCGDWHNPSRKVQNVVQVGVRCGSCKGRKAINGMTKALWPSGKLTRLLFPQIGQPQRLATTWWENRTRWTRGKVLANHIQIMGYYGISSLSHNVNELYFFPMISKFENATTGC